MHLCCRSPSVLLPVAVSRPFVFPALPSCPPSVCLLLLPLLFPSPLSCPCSFALPCPCWSSWSFPCPLACLCRPCPGPHLVFTVPVILLVLLLIAACNQKSSNKYPSYHAPGSCADDPIGWTSSGYGFTYPKQKQKTKNKNQTMT